jgi:hypothetical protein
MMRSALDAFDGSTLGTTLGTGSAPRTGALATPVAPGPPATGIDKKHRPAVTSPGDQDLPLSAVWIVF